MLVDIHLGHNKDYTLTYELFDNNVASKIWKRLNNKNFPVSQSSLFYGFGESSKDIEKNLNNCIAELKLKIPDLKVLSNDLNYLHNLYVSLHNKLLSEKYPSQKVQTLLQNLNKSIIHLNSLKGTNNTKILVNTEDTGEPLVDEDYDLFDPNMRKNWLYMNYPHIGKHIMGIFNSGDINIPKEQIIPTSVLKSNFVCWLDEDVLAGKTYLKNLNRFLAKIHNKLPYPIDDKKLAIGNIPLGRLTHEPDLLEIKRHNVVHSVKAS